MVSIGLICLIAFALFLSISSITGVKADNARPYCTRPDRPFDPGPLVINPGFVPVKPEIVTETE
jgi:hypothetical protein